MEAKENIHEFVQPQPLTEEEKTQLFMNEPQFIELIKESIEINKEFIRRFTKKHPLKKKDLAYYLKYGYIHPFYFAKFRKKRK